MKNKKTNLKVKGLSLFLLLVLTLTAMFGSVVQAGYDWVRPTSITAVGKKKVTMKVGEEKKLRVRMDPVHADDDFLRWKIVSGKKYVRFDDYDRSDDSIELIAKKAGTAKVRCYINGKPDKKVTFTVKVKKSSGKKKKTIAAKGSTTKYTEVYDDFDLEVRKLTSVSSKYLKWTIANKKIVGFEDGHETRGDDVEFHAKKVGTTKITCTNTKTKEKITFTVKVVNRYEDYDDDDDFWEYYDD